MGDGFKKITGEKEKILLLARSCSFEQGHAFQVTKLSVRLFYLLYPLHKLSKKYSDLLYAAAMLHDIGWVKGQKNHHKTSRDIIISSPLLKLEQKEKIIIALIARYHRGALPRKSHKYFTHLSGQDKEVVKKLAAILRLADGLDWRHLNLVKIIRCKIEGVKTVIFIKADGFNKNDLIKAEVKTDLFEKTFRKKVTISILK